MRFAIMGAGALGSYFGGRLAAAGNEVSFIARGAHLAALRSRGLTIHSPKGDLHLPAVRATDDPAEAGPADVVLFLVKNYDVESAGRALSPMIGPETMVVTGQNGISAPDRLAGIIGAAHVVPGVVRLPASVPGPGTVRHGARFDLLQFGERDGRETERCRRLHAALTGAGCMAEISPDIGLELWRKFIMQATLASFTALTRLDIGPLRDDPDTARLMRASMEETAEVARAVLGELPEGTLGRVWAFLAEELGPQVHASMLDDLSAGKRIEIDWLGGEVVRLGREHGVPTPIHETLAACLSPFRDGRGRNGP